MQSLNAVYAALGKKLYAKLLHSQKHKAQHFLVSW